MIYPDLVHILTKYMYFQDCALCVLLVKRTCTWLPIQIGCLSQYREALIRFERFSHCRTHFEHHMFEYPALCQKAFTKCQQVFSKCKDLFL